MPDNKTEVERIVSDAVDEVRGHHYDDAPDFDEQIEKVIRKVLTTLEAKHAEEKEAIVREILEMKASVLILGTMERVIAVESVKRIATNHNIQLL